MNLLVFSRDYFCNMSQLRCLDEKQILKLQELGISIHLIVQNHPCYNYKTIIHNEKGINISKVQQYPFTNFYSNNCFDNYYANNIRAQEGAMLFMKQDIKFDYIVTDNIGYGLAAQSYSEIFGTPIIYLKYAADLLKTDLSEVDEWLVNRSDYIIDEEQICTTDNANLKNKMILNILNIFRGFIITSNTNVKDKSYETYSDCSR